MLIKIVETSLNLRVETGKQKEDYSISKTIAKRQLSFIGIDIYTNVEFMDCNNIDYLKEFEKEGYCGFTTLDAKGRGILCEIKERYIVTKICEMTEPHMLHLRVENGKEYIDLITIRILVADGSESDFMNRYKQWFKVLNYIEGLPDKSHILLNGDFNHGVINNNIKRYNFRPRQYFNYQMIVKELKCQNLTLYPMKGYSYHGYMKIDHIATGEKIGVSTAEYKDVFKGKEIGIPDHSCLVASIELV